MHVPTEKPARVMAFDCLGGDLDAVTSSNLHLLHFLTFFLTEGQTTLEWKVDDADHGTTTLYGPDRTPALSRCLYRCNDRLRALWL